MLQKVLQDIVGSPLRLKFSKLSKAQDDEKEQNELKDVQRKISAQALLISDQTPRWVTCVSHDVYDGNIKEYAWDKEKIFVHECLQDDLLMLQNVFEGKIISSLIYPLVFDHKSPQKEMSLRSLQFYKETQSNPSLYHNLSPDDKGYFLIGARDLFIAACRGMLSQDEKEILANIVNLIDPRDKSVIYKTINNIDIAPYPTAIHKMVRFIEEEKKSGEDNNLLDECFVRNELGLLIGFVDPRDLSFHNLENIINLDTLFKAGEDFPIINFQKHGENEVYTFDLEDKKNILLSLDKCGLYTQPINKMSRGGERFIFASRVLGNNLTSSLRKHVSDKTIIGYNFVFVNYVFRYNKFKPGDKKFTSHLDTPYHDPARRHYSKYTLLLYLTSGSADPVLSFDNGKLKIDNIAVNNGLVKGIIFDQKYEHEGRSFIDSDKIFLRSELVYSYRYDRDVSFNADISRKFNIACYMTKQSVFNPELEKYASDCFNQVAQARIDLAKAKLTEDVLLYKTYHGVPFITNGYDYWFLKNTCLKSAAFITLLDYLGGKYLKCHKKKEGYARECSKYQSVDQGISENLQEITNAKDIFKYLKNYAPPSEEGIVKISNDEEDTEKHEIISSGEEDSEEDEEDEEEEDGEEKDNEEEDGEEKDNEEEGSEEEGSEEEDSDEDSDDAHEAGRPTKKTPWKDQPYGGARYYREKCPFCYDHGHPTNQDVEEFIQQNREKIRDTQRKFTVFIFNQEIKIKKSRIQINDDSIVFNENIPSVNFASCNYSMRDYHADEILDLEKLSFSGLANIPPIPYKIHDEGYHLKIELFNNGFVRHEEITLEKYSI